MSPKAKVVPEVGTIWRGFSHFWTYNHRLNRLGDFVKTNGKYECAGKEHNLNQPISIHTAASGSGEDKAHFTSYFSVIKTHNLKFIERIEIIDLEGEEKEKISKNIAVEVKLDGDRSFHEKDYSVLLNGFDLFADDSNAKKPIQLVIAVREVSLNESKNTLSFKLHVEFEAACSSFECWSDGKKVDYKFIVYYNVIYCESGLNKITNSLSRRVVWAKENLLSIPDDDQYSKMELNEDEIQGKGDNLFDQAFLGIRGFNFKMSNEFHYLKWCQFVTPKNYNSKTGNFNFHFGLH